MDSKIAGLRKEYMQNTLDEKSVHPNPIAQFRKWFDEAINSHIEEVNAMTLATVDSAGRPSARIVLLKGIDERGFSFFTNYTSRKAKELEGNPHVALVFFWKILERQVRITGIVSNLPVSESDEYFHSRPEGSQIGAWVSPQSQVISSREELENNFVEKSSAFKGKEIPRPEFWGGYVIVPNNIEFWQGRESRLHDRIRYRRQAGEWITERLAP
ncbi:MAG: pyridoxamine 5'-phosphate oxidase [Ferruginibacter sp.]|nr:pyridoxamine 5'-phosphate oxidase [Ferruginibacter sp.]